MSHGLGRLLYPGLAAEIGQLCDNYGFELAGITTDWLPKLGQPAIRITYFDDIPSATGHVKSYIRELYAPLTHEEYNRIWEDSDVHKKVLNNFEKQLMIKSKREDRMLLHKH